MWGMFCHLSALSGSVIPLGSIVGPLVIWLVKRDEHPFIYDQGRESLNFQISMFIYILIAVVLVFVFIGIVLLPILGILDLVFTIIAGVKANDGIAYRYPMTIRFIK